MLLEKEQRVTDDPTGGWARATEAIANASKEAIQASRELARFIRPPAAQVVGLLDDYLSVVRLELRVRLWDRVQKIYSERGMPGPTRNVPLNIAVPLLEHATQIQPKDGGEDAR
jgi:hypothetical protein